MAMASTEIVTQGRGSGDDYGLGAIVEHNAAGTEQFPQHTEDSSKGLGIYVSALLLSTLTLAYRSLA